MNRKQSTPTSKEQDKAFADVLKIGIDLHKSKYAVVCQYDGQAPMAPQSFSPEAFFAWVAKRVRQVGKAFSCYEAGCFGYVPHRGLEALGVANYVVRPRNWDEYGSKVKTDARDARELRSCLDRYLAGNGRALTPVRVPSEEEERARSLSRQRAALAKEIPSFLLELLAPYQALLELISRQLKESTAREGRTANRMLPVGLGALTASVLDREFVDCQRFSNRRQVASYTGLCPSEASSGGKRQQGSVSKNGNPRIRRVLIEAVWRMFRFQPEYRAIARWRERMRSEPFGPARRKKMAVAIAREFAIDWWRIQTGETRPEDIGLRMGYPAPCAAKALREGRVSRTYA